MVVFIKSVQLEGHAKQINVTVNGIQKDVVYDNLSSTNKGKFTKFYNDHKGHHACSISGHTGSPTEIFIITDEVVDVDSCPAEEYETMDATEKSDLDNFLEMVEEL